MIQGIALAIILLAALAWAGRRVWFALTNASDPAAKPTACRGCPHLDSCAGQKEPDDDPR